MQFLIISIILILINSVFTQRPSSELNSAVACGGYIRLYSSDVKLTFNRLSVHLLSGTDSNLHYVSDVLPNGAYSVPVYDPGTYRLQVSGPPGWSFEPSTGHPITIRFDSSSGMHENSGSLQGSSATNACQSRDYNFNFTGFSVNCGVTIRQVEGLEEPSLAELDQRGPANLTIQLLQSDHKLAECRTSNQGRCTISRVMSGDFSLRLAPDPKNGLKLREDEIDIRVVDDVLTAPLFQIRGFPVRVGVHIGDRPLEKARMLLWTYSQSKELDRALGELRRDLNCPAPSKQLMKKVVKAALGGRFPICEVSTDVEGRAHLDLLPRGNYSLEPYYSRRGIDFTFSPSFLPFQVNNCSVHLGDKAFQISGFSITGRVRHAERGDGKRPVAGARIQLLRPANEIVASGVSDERGEYRLEDLQFGGYRLTAQAEHLSFSSEEVDLSRLDRLKLPDLLVDGLAVCGHVMLDRLSGNHGDVISSQRLVEIKRTDLSSNPAEKSLKSMTDEFGDFCVFLSPGNYSVRPIVEVDDEEKYGLRFSPQQHEISVVDKPILDLRFSQFQAVVAGTLRCLAACDQHGWTVDLWSITDHELSLVGNPRSQSVQFAPNSLQLGSFLFSGVLPGVYGLAVRLSASIGDSKEDSSSSGGGGSWCWESDRVTIRVDERNFTGDTGIHWVQSGYRVQVFSSHSATVAWSLQDDELTASMTNSSDSKQKKKGKSLSGQWNLTFGQQHVCVRHPGLYDLTFHSCHRLKLQNRQQISVVADPHLSPDSVIVEASHHQVRFRLELYSGDVSMVDRLLAEISGENTRFFLLREDLDQSGDEEPQILDYKLVKDASRPPVVATADLAVWIAVNSSVRVDLQSSVVLFSPADSLVLSAGLGVECTPLVAVVKLKRGLFISGRVEPPIKGVTVRLECDVGGGNRQVSVGSTDEAGFFRFGPQLPELSAHSQFDDTQVLLNMTGYVFSVLGGPEILPSGDRFYRFAGKKLAQVVVRVRDMGRGSAGDNQSQEAFWLPDVLISVVGDDYRNNMFTDSAGQAVFMGLSPGTFYVRAMMKEYHFEPHGAVEVLVEEGRSVEQQLIGRRTAFSIYGEVRTLNGDVERQVMLEAREISSNEAGRVCGGGTAADSQQHTLIEQALTGETGKFRLRGLKPGCQYDVLISLEQAKNGHLDRAVPTNRIVTMSHSDQRNITFVTYRRLNRLEVMVWVQTDDEDLFLPSLHLLVHPHTRPDHVLFRHSFGNTSLVWVLKDLPVRHPHHLGSSNDGDNDQPTVYVLRMESTLSPLVYRNISAQELVFSADPVAYYRGWGAAQGVRWPGYQQKHLFFHFRPQLLPSAGGGPDLESQPSLLAQLAMPVMLLAGAVLALHWESAGPWLRLQTGDLCCRLAAGHSRLAGWIGRSTSVSAGSSNSARLSEIAGPESLGLDPSVMQSLNSLVARRPGQATSSAAKKSSSGMFWSKSRGKA